MHHVNVYIIPWCYIHVSCCTIRAGTPLNRLHRVQMQHRLELLIGAASVHHEDEWIWSIADPAVHKGSSTLSASFWLVSSATCHVAQTDQSEIGWPCLLSPPPGAAPGGGSLPGGTSGHLQLLPACNAAKVWASVLLREIIIFWFFSTNGPYKFVW